MKVHLLLFTILFSLSLTLSLALSTPPSKIHDYIYEFYQTHHESVEVSSMLLLEEQADVESAISDVPFEERGEVVFQLLYKTATVSQESVVRVLETLGVTYRAYWLVNMIVIRANYSTLHTLSTHNSVRAVHPNFEFRVPLEVPESYDVDGGDDVEDGGDDGGVSAPYAVEWNLNWVKAPQVWSLGYQGKDFVVAIADTGVQWEHPALKPQYRGYTDASNINHNYNWWDAVHETGSRCGKDTKAPCDDSGHGTHTTGTAAGSDHGANQIGVAPGAKWIGCRNMNAGFGSPTLYIECLQYFVAPTDLEGKNHNPSLRPHAIGNSYGCPPEEKCVPDSLQIAVNNVIAAGIFMSVSAGNSGPQCSTVSDPPAIYDNVFSVGALAFNSSNIASFSSRGPVTVDGSHILKPDISAPGSNIRSSYPNNTYAYLSGTSMASPHITGIIALVWDARPELARDIATTTKVLETTSKHMSNTACGGNSAQNNVYGYGEVDVYAAATAKNV